MTREEYVNAILEVTGGPAWERVQEGLDAEIRNLEIRELQSEDWGDIKELRGSRRTLINVKNWRELIKLEQNTDA